MTEISRVSEGLDIDNYAMSIPIEKKEETKPIATAEVNASLGESEKILIAKEALHRALSPNLRDLDREQEIKIRLDQESNPNQRFDLIKELLTIKIKAFIRAGLSIEEFIQEAKRKLKDKELNFSFSGENGDLKTELLALYTACFDEACAIQELGRSFPYTYTSPYLQLFEFEKEFGFPLLGTSLLIKETRAYVEILLDRLEDERLYKYDGSFDWLIAFPGFQKILRYLEQEGDKKIIETMTRIVQLIYFFPSRHLLFPNEEIAQDPLILLFPYIVKYASLDQIKNYFDERFKDLKEWDRSCRWIDLHCQAAETLAPIDPEKANNYLEKAEKEVEAKLWSYPFSFQRKEIEEARQKALQRIDEVKAKNERLYQEASSL